MYTRHVDGAATLDNDQDVLAWVATFPVRPPDATGDLKFVALLDANDKLCRVIRTESADEFSDLHRGLLGLGFMCTDHKAIHGVIFDSVCRRVA